MMVRFQRRCLIHSPFSFLSMPNDVLDRLMLELHQRVASLPEGSYTTKLLQGGIPKMGAKLLEESSEVIEAAAESGEPGREHTIREAADVVFHLWVLLASRGIVVDDVRRELERREGVSGLEEKRRRGQETVS
jgi:phosphoribosyl-ATP pyrophosphohydrolase